MADKVNLHDFSKMYLNLSLVEEGKTFLEVFPQFANVKAYQEASEIEIKIAILMCDREGPFSKIKKFEDRLIAIFSWLRLSASGKDETLFSDTLAGKQVKIADIWTHYLASQFDHEWTSWFSNSLVYYQLMTILRKPISVSDDEELFNQQFKLRGTIETRADAIYKRMKEMEAILFVDETVKRRAQEREKNKIENFAEKFADDNSVI